MKPKIGIIGSTGYTGVVLTKLLLNNKEIEITYLSSQQYANKPYYEAHPMFYKILDLKCKEANEKEIAKSCDLVFFTTPNNFSKDFLPKLIKEKNNIKVIDLSADFRLENKLVINKTNTFQIAYGLPEIYRKQIKNSQIIANPGCYPTSVILGLAPVIKNNLINPDPIIIDSKSGASGAGRQIKQELHFCEINESFSAYNLAGKHRHINEIESELSKLANKDITVNFSPHLLPINRGILSTIYAKLKNETSQEDIYTLYSDFYKNEYFIKVLQENIYANTKNVRYTNFCHITPIKDERSNMLIILSAIDNMVKGASGQAIQNMNIILTFNEELGLEGIGEIP